MRYRYFYRLIDFGCSFSGGWYGWLELINAGDGGVKFYYIDNIYRLGYGAEKAHLVGWAWHVNDIWFGYDVLWIYDGTHALTVIAKVVARVQAALVEVEGASVARV